MKPSRLLTVSVSTTALTLLCTAHAAYSYPPRMPALPSVEINLDVLQRLRAEPPAPLVAQGKSEQRLVWQEGPKGVPLPPQEAKEEKQAPAHTKPAQPSVVAAMPADKPTPTKKPVKTVEVAPAPKHAVEQSEAIPAPAPSAPIEHKVAAEPPAAESPKKASSKTALLEKLTHEEAPVEMPAEPPPVAAPAEEPEAVKLPAPTPPIAEEMPPIAPPAPPVAEPEAMPVQEEEPLVAALPPAPPPPPAVVEAQPSSAPVPPAAPEISVEAPPPPPPVEEPAPPAPAAVETPPAAATTAEKSWFHTMKDSVAGWWKGEEAEPVTKPVEAPVIQPPLPPAPETLLPSEPPPAPVPTAEEVEAPPAPPPAEEPSAEPSTPSEAVEAPSMTEEELGAIPAPPPPPPVEEPKESPVAEEPTPEAQIPAPPPPALPPAPEAVEAPPPPAVEAPEPQTAALPGPADIPAASDSNAPHLSVAFGVTETTVPLSARPELDGLAAQLKSDESKRITIVAYASGSAEQPSTARRVSLSRAIAVRAYLIDQGVNNLRINVQAEGSKNAGDKPDRVDIFFQTAAATQG